MNIRAVDNTYPRSMKIIISINDIYRKKNIYIRDPVAAICVILTKIKRQKEREEDNNGSPK